MCQSPIYRDTHFYEEVAGYIGETLACVNPLSIGTPISTKGYATIDEVKALCQSPIYRDTHFYQVLYIG